MYSPSEFSRTTTTIDGIGAAQRPGDAGERPRRTHARVEVERLPQADQRRQRDVVRQPRRPADGAEEDGVEAAQLVEEVLRRDAPVPVVVGHAPRPLEAALRRSARDLTALSSAALQEAARIGCIRP